MRAIDVLVVGAGPAGLTAAARLAASGVGRVEVLDREQHAGESRGTAPTAATGPGCAR